MESKKYKVFHWVIVSPNTILSQARILSMDMQLKSEHLGLLGLNLMNSRWDKPPPGYLKLNIYDNFRDGRMAFGGLLRDDHDNWV